MKTNQQHEQYFLDILEQYQGIIRRVCLMYSRSNHDYDDLYQETLANMWRGIGGFRGESALSTWIYRTTVNTCITWLRRNSRHDNHLDLDQAINAIAGEDELQRERVKWLYSTISRLNPFEKALIMLWLDDKSYDEIADITGLTRANVAVRLHRLKAKLKELSSNF